MILYWWAFSILCRSLLFAAQTLSHSSSYICLGIRKPRMWDWCTTSFLVIMLPSVLEPIEQAWGLLRTKSSSYVLCNSLSLPGFKCFLCCGYSLRQKDIQTVCPLQRFFFPRSLTSSIPICICLGPWPINQPICHSPGIYMNIHIHIYILIFSCQASFSSQKN